MPLTLGKEEVKHYIYKYIYIFTDTYTVGNIHNKSYFLLTQ